ncbi:uncharacterized protein LOC131680470 [Topomyia yanbarensis]|uniref:uncharacterized protein LOC131680470 n=1 Tax=Topomyia yanbarensis TaxID=2498891 RepID=UPI00273CC19E|nr:uncharacterized protein LOC131680470 [Topomyia yanbarensis]
MDIKRPAKYGKNYTPAVLSTALAKVQNHEMSIKKAAKYFGIPRSTIRSRILKKNQDQIRAGPDTNLLMEEENELEAWIIDMQNRGYPITKNWLLDSVKQFMDATPRKNRFVNNRPGKCTYRF